MGLLQPTGPRLAGSDADKSPACWLVPGPYLPVLVTVKSRRQTLPWMSDFTGFCQSDTQEILCNWIRQTAPGKLDLKLSKANVSTFPPTLLYGAGHLDWRQQEKQGGNENRTADLHVASEALHQAALPSHPPSSAISVLPFEFRQS